MRKLLAIHHLNINSKKLFDVITNFMVHIDNCYIKNIISYSKYSNLLSKLEEIIENFNINNLYFSLKRDTIIKKRQCLEDVYKNMYYIVLEIGALNIDDILYILCRINMCYYNSNHKIHSFNKIFVPISCEIKDINTHKTNIDIEKYEENIIFFKLNDTDNFLLNIHGAQMVFPIKIRNMLLSINGYFKRDPLNIQRHFFNKKINLNEISVDKRIFFEGFFRQLSLRDHIIYTKTQLLEKCEYNLNLVAKYKEITISAIVKEFLNMNIEDQIELLTLFLLHKTDNESQYMAYLLYDMISNESYLLKPQPLAEQVYNNLHWSVQKLFKIALKKIEKNNKEFQDFNEDDISYEKRIMLLKANETTKNKAMEKYKEIINKNGENASKAQQYLDGLLKIPFGIYKKEEIIAFLGEFRRELKSFNTQYLEIYNKDINNKISSVEISNFLKILNKNKNDTHKKFNINYLSKKFKVGLLRSKAYNVNSLVEAKFAINDVDTMNKNNLCKELVYVIDSKENSNKKTELLQLFDFDMNDIYNQKLSLLNIHWNDHKVQSKKYIKHVEETLDKAVYGQHDAKKEIKRIIAQWINGEMKGYVFGFEGPPGTGKTSLAKKGISKCLKDRPFAFIAMGGSSNGSTLEGHSYTYVGSTWGKIVDILRDSQCMNPIIYIDELDKISNTENGREIVGILTHLTDPSQNDEFQDKYFSGVKLDLSKILFVFSYNDFDKIDPILADRIHRIKFNNINMKEKKYIIENYLLPEFLDNVGLPEKSLTLDTDTLDFIIENYTHEAGIRSLKQKVFEIIREINLRIIMNNENIKFPYNVTRQLVENIFSNKRKIVHKKISISSHIGLVNGLYATNMGTGGITIIQIFKTYSDVKLSLMITGQQGDVMKESIKCAKTIAWNLLPPSIKKNTIKDLEKQIWGLHVHCPEASVPKDGPSAGAAITLALISLFTNIPIRNDVALTGEIDLNGDILVIGGLEYKIEGGKKAGVSTICYPEGNYQDIEIIKNTNPDVLDNINLIKVKNILQVLEICLEPNDLKFNQF